MKKVSISLFLVLAAFLFMSSAFAAEMESGGGMSGTSSMPAAQAGNPVLSSELIGKEVLDQNNQKIGKIENLVLDQSTGRISLAIIETEKGFLNIGDKFVAVPFESISHTAAGMQASLTKDQLAKAPTFSRDQLKKIDRSTESEVYKYFGVAPYWEEAPQEQPGMEQPGM
jgi:sporulation protein YlmC with PRC-barrel domain